MDVAKKFGMVQPNASTTQAVGVFIIDPKGHLRAISLPAQHGRNKQEIKLLVLPCSPTTRRGHAATWQRARTHHSPPGACGTPRIGGPVGEDTIA
jgi:peroxiredoxin (alkyl hydroperoxide reductase subunit C)